MQGTRLQKIERLIQKDLSEIMLGYAQRLRQSEPSQSLVMISVSEVRISPDLSIANVYLSIFPDNRHKDVMLQIEHDKGSLRGELGDRERHQLRIIPELKFHIDETLERMERIDELLRQ